MNQSRDKREISVTRMCPVDVKRHDSGDIEDCVFDA